MQAIAEPFLAFLRWEASSGVILLACAILALIVANSPLAESYEHLLHYPIAIGAGEYHEMLGMQAALRQGWGALYGGADLVLTPSTPGPAPLGLEHTGDASYNKIWSVLGWPCLHLPTGFSRAGLPMGMQLVGDLGKDLALLAIGRDLHHLLKQQGE